MIQNSIISGKKLPTLTNPAGAANIQTGYEAIDGSGEKITGINTAVSSGNVKTGTFTLTSQTKDDIGMVPQGEVNVDGGFQHFICFCINADIPDSFVTDNNIYCFFDIFSSDDNVVSRRVINRSVKGKLKYQLLTFTESADSYIAKTDNGFIFWGYGTSTYKYSFLPGTYEYIAW